MTQRFPDEDPLNDAGRHYYGSIRGRILRQVLDSARQGTLTTSWRDSLQPPTYNIPPHPLYSDADLLAVEDLRQTAPAPWEPDQSASWREALDTWYLAYRGILIDQAAASQHNLARILQTRNQTLTSRYHGILRRTTTTTTTLADEIRGTLSDFDHNIDLSRGQFNDLYIAQRDRLSASYLAGLAAGGDANSWVEWLEARVAKWNNSAAAEATRAQIASPEFRATFEQLPAYWSDD